MTSVFIRRRLFRVIKKKLDSLGAPGVNPGDVLRLVLDLVGGAKGNATMFAPLQLSDE